MPPGYERAFGMATVIATACGYTQSNIWNTESRLRCKPVSRSAAIYCRISQDREGAGLGVARQRQDCEALAQQRGWEVYSVYVDNDLSAYSGKPRPAYERMLADIKDGVVDAVIVWHSDRLHRRLIELEAFIDLVNAHRIEIATCTGGDYDLSTSDGRFLARIIGSTARKESEDKSRRTRRKHKELAENGMVSGGGHRPFGFEADRVTIREEEAEEIRDAARRILSGESLRGITHDWRLRGVRTVTGAVWSPTTIKRLLVSGRISGQREHRDPDGEPGAARKIVGPAVWPAIISPQETARLRARLNNPARSNGEAPARSYLLSGFVICGACGNRLSARAAIRKGNRYRRYHCAKDRGGCDRVGISAARLEELVTGLTLARLDTPEVTAHMAADANEDETAQLVDEVQRLEADLEQLARDHYVDKAIGRIEFFAARSDLVAALTATREKVAKRRPVDVLAGLEGEGLRAAWPGLSLARQRAILATVLESVTVGSTTRGNNRFDPSRVEPPNGEVRWRV
jgi:site-specific DNA recombinase